MLLGVILLLIIQRSLVAIYFIVSDSNSAYDLLTVAQLQMVNWGSVILAVLIGLVYGNYLGHHWYPLVYGEKKDENKPVKSASGAAEAVEPQQKTITVKPVRSVRNKVSLKSEIRDHDWDFDDLINHDMPAVESLGSSAPGVSSAVSLGEPVVKKIKRTVVRKTKPVVKSKSIKTPAKATAKKAATKIATKATAKVKIKS